MKRLKLHKKEVVFFDDKSCNDYIGKKFIFTNDVIEEHKKLDMNHSFCPVCFEAGVEEGIRRSRKKSKLFTVGK